jgi:hypothetical protein
VAPQQAKPAAPQQAKPAAPQAAAPQQAKPPVAPARLAGPDPVAVLKELLVRLQRDGTEERVTDFNKPERWTKRKYEIANLKYDVRRTDSLVSPFTAKVVWTSVWFETTEFPTEGQARRAELPARPAFVPRADSLPDWAELAFQDGKWVVQDTGCGEPGRMYMRRSVQQQSGSRLEDWWRAFGGEPAPEPAEEKERQEPEAKQAEAKQAEAKQAEEKKRQEPEAKQAEGKRKADAVRTWTDANTGRTMDAQFLGSISGKVKLRKADGTVFSVPTERLSEEDQEWVRKRSKR